MTNHLTELTICTGTSCKSKAAGLLVKKAEKKLGCYIGKASSNKQISLMDHECLGNCKSGPSIRLDRYIFPQVSESELEVIIDAVMENDHQFLKSITESATLDLSLPLIVGNK